MKVITSILRTRPFTSVKAFIPFSFLPAVMAVFFYLPCVSAQGYIPADPYYLLLNEKKQIDKGNGYYATAMRPFFKNSDNNAFISFKSELYWNNEAPNQENMDVRYFGKGMGTFQSVHFAWMGKYLSLSFEPFILKSENKDVKRYSRPKHYNVLNDVVQNPGSNFTRQGLRNSHIYIHYKGIGIGLSNESMWWGPGIQGSLSMTNNTVGFPHYSIGTIKELRWRNWGFYGKYTLATIKENSQVDDAFYTSLAGSVTYYSYPIITIGLSRNYMTGGVNMGVPWTIKDASKIVFEDFFIENLRGEKYTWPSGHDPFDQTLTGFLSMMLPKSKMKLYLEVGYNDNRNNLWDYIIHPDHSIATILGFQNYGLFNNEDLVFGFEYASLVNSRMQVFRGFPPWYARTHYDDWSYEGRRWGAHSGSDSDDLLIFFGWMNEKWSFVPAFNYERHGITTYRPPEVKTELRLNAHYQLQNHLNIGFYFEQQHEAHLGFPNDHFWLEVTGKRKTNTVIIRIEKILDL